MLFSVITPCYNSEAWIRRCISSVAAGNDTVEYEHIIIDDGSTDQTLSICLSMASKDPHIKVIHRENRGYCATMNELIALCTGDYIISVDSDNWLSEGALTILAGEVNKTNADYYQFSIAQITIDGKVIAFSTLHEYAEFFDRRSIEKAIRRQKIDLSTHGGKAISKSLFVPGVSFVGNPCGADSRLMEKISYISTRVAYVAGPTLYFEIREGSLSHAKTPPFFWADYIYEEMKTFSFFKNWHRRQLMPIAELATLFSLYIRTLSDEIIDPALYRRNGRSIWRNRKWLCGKTNKVNGKGFCCCHFPLLSRQVIRIRNKIRSAKTK